MLFGELIDVVEAYAVPIGLAVGFTIGLYSYWRGKSREEAEPDPEPPARSPDERVCPHCRVRFTDAGDAYCPECREPLDE